MMCLSKCEASNCHFVEHISLESISSLFRYLHGVYRIEMYLKMKRHSELQCCQSMPIQNVRIIDIDNNIDIVRFAKQNPVMFRKTWVLLSCYMSGVIASLLFGFITFHFKMSLQLHRNTIPCDKVYSKSFTSKNIILTRSVRLGCNEKNAQEPKCVFNNHQTICNSKGAINRMHVAWVD